MSSVLFLVAVISLLPRFSTKSSSHINASTLSLMLALLLLFTPLEIFTLALVDSPSLEFE